MRGALVVLSPFSPFLPLLLVPPSPVLLLPPLPPPLLPSLSLSLSLSPLSPSPLSSPLSPSPLSPPSLLPPSFSSDLELSSSSSSPSSLLDLDLESVLFVSVDGSSSSVLPLPLLLLSSLSPFFPVVCACLVLAAGTEFSARRTREDLGRAGRGVLRAEVLLARSGGATVMPLPSRIASVL